MGREIRYMHCIKAQYDWQLLFIIGIQPLGRSGQRPEFSQATGMVLPVILY